MNKQKTSARRKMAWASLVAALAFPLLILATEAAVLGQVATPFYSFVTLVVSVYIGADAYNRSNGDNRRGDSTQTPRE